MMFALLLASALRGRRLVVNDTSGAAAVESNGAVAVESAAEASTFCTSALQSWYDLMDNDRKGGLTQAELSHFLAEHTDIRTMLRGVTEAADDGAVMRSLDADGSGSVEFGEFRAFWNGLGLLQTGTTTHTHGQGDEAAILDEVDERLKKVMSRFPGINSVEEILRWRKELAPPYMGAPGRDPVLPARPRVMSIHDMAGGYARNPDNLYLELFQSWDTVDVFVYFSHLRLAVPPQQWVAAAHSHGAVALGTIMFEGGDGAQAAAAAQEQQDKFIEKVAEITEHYGFDGWLVNVEAWSGASSPAAFVEELTKKMREKLGKRSYIVAYPYGPESEMFGKTDAVYVDYGWQESAEAMERVKKSAALKAPGAQHDVYMGLDAFGSRRGNSEPDSAHVGLCATHDLSVAVFAPGYTLEVQAAGKYTPEAEKGDLAFWAPIKEAMHFDRRKELADFPAFNAEAEGTVVSAAPQAVVPDLSDEVQRLKEQKEKEQVQRLEEKLAEAREQNRQLVGAKKLAEARPVAAPAGKQRLEDEQAKLQARAEEAERAAASAREHEHEAEQQLAALKQTDSSWSRRHHYTGIGFACIAGLGLFFMGRYTGKGAQK